MTIPTKLLLIGSLPPPIGGVTVLFKQLVDDISSRDNLCVQTINLPSQQGSVIANFFTATGVMLKIIRLLPRSDVISLQATIHTTLLLGPIVWFLCKLFRKKSNLRKFGGVFDKDFEQLPTVLRWLIKNTVLKMNLLMFETQALVDYFSDLSTEQVVWYPNSRPLSSEIDTFHLESFHGKARKFIFIGHVKQTKGIQEIIEVANQIEEPIEIDVFGPIIDDFLANTLLSSNVHYKGVLPPEHVAAVLQSYDVLLLPTYHEGEGYPGVIIEAYCNGLPVITTQWNAIPEIVDGDSGILIQPKDVDELKRAILKLVYHPEEFARLKIGAIRKAQSFSSKYWADIYVNYIFNLAATDKQNL